MTKKTKAWIVLTTPLIVGFLLGLLVGRCTSRGSAKAAQENLAEEIENEREMIEESNDSAVIEDAEIEEVIPKEEKKEIIYYRKRLPYSKMFADLNEDHLVVAKRYGLSAPPKTRNSVNTSGLVKIEDNDYIKVWDLKYSVPYLTRSAAKELNAIARAFSDSLENHKLLDYKLVVSSVLRTEEDVAKLRRSGNPNASANSAHCYGTTFDIAYTRYYRDNEEAQDAFMQPFELTKVLGEVLSDRKKQGKILCKYERVEHCFHITVCY